MVRNVLVVVHQVWHMAQGYWHPCKFNFMYSIVVQLKNTMDPDSVICGVLCLLVQCQELNSGLTLS